MALIRGDVDRLPAEVRLQLVNDLRTAVEYPSTGGPVIFEIPFVGTRYDIMVVWDEWKGVQQDERVEIISEAYSNRSVEIAQAMGVTYNEAMQDHLLPYQVQPCAGAEEADLAALRKAMLDNGAISLGEEKLDLRFPTARMAEAAHERLVKEIPNGRWALVLEGGDALEKYYH